MFGRGISLIAAALALSAVVSACHQRLPREPEPPDGPGKGYRLWVLAGPECSADASGLARELADQGFRVSMDACGDGSFECLDRVLYLPPEDSLDATRAIQNTLSTRGSGLALKRHSESRQYALYLCGAPPVRSKAQAGATPAVKAPTPIHIVAAPPCEQQAREITLDLQASGYAPRLDFCGSLTGIACEPPGLRLPATGTASLDPVAADNLRNQMIQKLKIKAAGFPARPGQKAMAEAHLCEDQPLITTLSAKLPRLADYEIEENKRPILWIVAAPDCAGAAIQAGKKFDSIFNVSATLCGQDIACAPGPVFLHPANEPEDRVNTIVGRLQEFAPATFTRMSQPEPFFTAYLCGAPQPPPTPLWLLAGPGCRQEAATIKPLIEKSGFKVEIQRCGEGTNFRCLQPAIQTNPNDPGYRIRDLQRLLNLRGRLLKAEERPGGPATLYLCGDDPPAKPDKKPDSPTKRR
ncbi:MAG: hypothetical protein GMKNLPBB_00253 [Myxococcota bacterium]|nr:hypothetical protein [Myxococcota bacterium]